MPGLTKKPTMSDVAARLGISQAAVSLVLNDAPGTRISQKTRERVLAVAKELGYEKPERPSAGNGVIGFMINELTTSPHLGALFEGARDEAANNGCIVSLYGTQGNPEIEAEVLDHILSRPVVGIIYASLLTQAVHPPGRLLGVPTVLLNCQAAKDVFPSVVPGDVAGAFAATQALLEAGHRRIGILSGEDWIEAARDRMLGFRQALTTFDVAVESRLIMSGGWTHASGREQTHRLLDLPDPPTAIFCYCDRMAVGAYEAVRERGLTVPKDLSIVGFDNEAVAADLSPPLTTVELPMEAMGRWSVTRLLDLAHDAASDTRRRKIKMECRLISRASVAPPVRTVDSAEAPTTQTRRSPVTKTGGQRKERTATVAKQLNRVPAQ